MKRTTILLAALLALASGCEDKAPGPGGEARTTATVIQVAPPATAATPSATTSAPAKVYDCGAKDQKPCPMQGWMKTVMTSASAGDDPAKLAQALSYVAARPPPGFADWPAIASDGAGKAKAGDIDGAKASCKKCHDTYKETYKATMRDRAW